VGKRFELSDNFKIRGEKAFKRITSGLIKLLFPDKSFDRSELELVARIALEARQMVRDWLHRVAPGEFPREELSARILS